MCLVFEKRQLLVVVFAIAGMNADAQNVSSPYSILGLGDIESKDFGRYSATGHSGLARRDGSSYNFSNPASLTAFPFKTMHLDIVTRSKISVFRSPNADTSTWPSRDIIFKRVTAAFKLSDKSALAVGLKPYSTVNYQFTSQSASADDATFYKKSETGSGGLNQFYASYAYQFSPRFSAGVTASYLFGSIIDETRFTRNEVQLDVLRRITNSYWGGSLLAGLQYFTKADKRWQHQFGLVAGVTSSLSGQTITEYFEDTTTLTKTIADRGALSMPMQVGFGYTAILRNAIHFTIQGNYFDWPVINLEYRSSFTTPSYQLSAGIEYSKKQKFVDWRNGMKTSIIERFYLGAGIHYEKNYMVIDGQPLYDYSATMGGGIHVSRNLSVYGGVELGRKGDYQAGQIRERYVQFNVGFTLKDIWIGPRYTRRYY